MSSAVLKAAGELSIYQVADLKPRWWAALDAGCTCLDLSEVVEIDGAGLQLVLALSHAARLRGASLSLQGASEPVQSAFALVGASRLLAHPDQEAEHA